MAGSNSPIQIVPYDQAYEAGFEDMPRRVPDISKICNLIGIPAAGGPAGHHQERRRTSATEIR
jgi:hypothetical protein